MYVCGPTVYARPHIGNARSVVVYDVLYRLLKELYPNVTYVRNITDVDDKINSAAIERGISIQALTQEVTDQFHEDVGALNVLRPTVEPRATEHISHIIEMVEQLIGNNNAYESEGHVLFDVTSNDQYGMLSGRKLEEMAAGARVEVEDYKHHPGDFVLWKPADEEDDASSKFESPWGVGRPGWHIECSAMSTEHLGKDFDIHGGGSDLMFPHHENEIAQSTCAHPGSHYAKYWVHNGFLTVDGEKMSKSLGNFITVHDLLEQGMKGEVIRLALMMTHYRKPFDWTDKVVSDARKMLDKWYNLDVEAGELPKGFLDAMNDDMNLPLALSLLHNAEPEEVVAGVKMLGFLTVSKEEWFGAVDEGVEALIEAIQTARANKDYATADAKRAEIGHMGYKLEYKPDGTIKAVKQ
jgi:cysteinyl-tRNA synthetase